MYSFDFCKNALKIVNTYAKLWEEKKMYDRKRKFPKIRKVVR